MRIARNIGVGIMLAVCCAQPGIAAEDPKAQNARLLKCYEKVLVPAKYAVSKKLVKPVTRKYVHRGGLVELWEYPAVYEEIRKLIAEEYFLMREAPCKPVE